MDAQLAPGRVIDNPISGERIVIRTSGVRRPMAGLLCFDVFLPPGGHVPPGTSIPNRSGAFHGPDGSTRVPHRPHDGGGRVQARPLPSRPASRIGSATGGSVVARAGVEVEPALRTEELLAATEELSRAGRLFGTRLPRLCDLAVVLLEFQRELAVPRIPARLVRLVLTPFAWLGRRGT